MKSARIKKAGYNLCWLIIYEVTIFICNLILPRLIISTYGSAYNGLISSVTQFLNFVSILRLGVAGATRVALYKPLADNDTKQISAVVKATQLYMQKIGYAIIGVIAVLAVAYPTFITKEFGFLNTVVIIVAVGMGTFSQYFFGITYRTLLQADQRLYINNFVQTIATILNTALSAFLITRGVSIQVVKIVYALIFTISPICLNRYVIYRYNIDTHCEPDNNALYRKNDVMGQSIANIVHDNTDVIVLTLFAGVKIVSVYSVYNLVMTGIRQVMNIFTTGTEAIFGNMWAKGEEDSIRRNLSYFEYMIGVLLSIIFSVAGLLIVPFVSLYTKGTTDVNYILPAYAIMTVASQAIFSFRMPYLTLVQAAGHYKETKHAAYAEAAMNLGISLVLVQFFGIIGVGIGTLVANIFRTAHYAIYANSHLVKRNMFTVLQRVLWIICNTVVTILICSFLFGDMASIGWVNWGICGIVGVAVSAVVCLITSFILYREDLRGMFGIAKRMLNK